MPVSFFVATHQANAVSLDPDVREGLTGEEIFAKTCRNLYKAGGDVLQFALVGREGS
jgi:hypothetical protein